MSTDFLIDNLLEFMGAIDFVSSFKLERGSIIRPLELGVSRIAKKFCCWKALTGFLLLRYLKLETAAVLTEEEVNSGGPKSFG